MNRLFEKTFQSTGIAGLTGGIATGKTTVSRMFASLGADIIDADAISRSLLTGESPLLDIVRNTFGNGFFSKDGSLDRDKMRSEITSNPESKRRLEDILHPAVFAEEEKRIASSRARVIIVDAALMIETGSYTRFATRILVYAKPEIQLRRLMERDGMNREAAESFIRLQIPINQKRAFATHIIDNSGEIDATERQVHELYSILEA